MNRLGPERQRRGASDGIDAGFRIAMSAGMVMTWMILVALLFTGERHHWWAYAAIVAGLPFPAATVFAFLSLKSWLDEREWMRAEQIARNSPAVGSGGTTSA